MKRHDRSSCASILIGALALAVCAKLGGEVRAGFTFLSPTPYLSAADSPFAKYQGGPNFFLEDFEDGELNTPGIYQPVHPVFGTAFQGVVMPPGEFTDSVDADDGVIDGSGSAGHSFRSRALFYNQTIPQRNEIVFEIEFNTNELGYLPNVFGCVWTDGPVGIDYFRPGLELRMVVTDLTGTRFVAPPVKPTVSMNRAGETSEDVFLGVLADVGIVHVTIAGIYYGDSDLMPYLEIDHVQYGRLTVPEPGAFALAILLARFLVTRRLR